MKKNETSKTRFYKLPAAAKGFLGLNKIEGKGKLGKTKDLRKRSAKLNTVKLHYSRIHYSGKLHHSRQFAVDRGFLFNKNPK